MTPEKLALLSLMVDLFKALITGGVVALGTVYGFKRISADFKTMLAESLAKKIDVTEYAQKNTYLHEKINAGDRINAVQDNEITHLWLEVNEHRSARGLDPKPRPRHMTDSDPTPPMGTLTNPPPRV